MGQNPGFGIVSLRRAAEDDKYDQTHLWPNISIAQCPQR